MDQKQPKTFHLEVLKLEQLRQELLRDGVNKFQQKYPCAFLVLIAQIEPDMDSNDHRSLTTISFADITQEEAVDITEETLIEKNESIDTKKMICYAVAKSTRNHFTSKITVGRAQNNDIVLLFRSVSQVHAALFQDEEDDWKIVDMGSTNGTRLNGHRLDNNKQKKICNGDIVSFASHTFRFMTWADFHKLLMKDQSTFKLLKQRAKNKPKIIVVQNRNSREKKTQ